MRKYVYQLQMDVFVKKGDYSFENGVSNTKGENFCSPVINNNWRLINIAFFCTKEDISVLNQVNDIAYMFLILVIR